LERGQVDDAIFYEGTIDGDIGVEVCAGAVCILDVRDDAGAERAEGGVVVAVAVEVQGVEVLRELCCEYEVDHLPSPFLPFQDCFGWVRVWAHRDPRTRSSLREDARPVSKRIANGGKLSHYPPQGSFKFFIDLKELVFPKIFMRELREIFQKGKLVLPVWR